MSFDGRQNVLDSVRIFPGVTDIVKDDDNDAYWDQKADDCAGHGKYSGMSGDEVRAFWKKNNENAMKLGTRMHERIQTWYDFGADDWAAKATRWDGETAFSLIEERTKFEMFEKHRLSLRWEPWRAEWIVFDEVAEIAGMIDMVFQCPDGTFAVVDWKRSKELNAAAGRQVKRYVKILEDRYDMKVSVILLVRIHPNAEEPEIVKV